MPAPISSRKRVLDQLVGLFRRDGYDGVSISRISDVTGLGRPSLYYYFPGGKDEMAHAVLDAASKWFDENVAAVARGDGTPASRLKTMLVNIDRFYSGGREACLLNAFMLGETNAALSKPVRAAFEAWVDAFALISRDTGATKTQARRRAEGAVARIQGALVLARSLNDDAIFARTLRDIETLILE